MIDHVLPTFAWGACLLLSFFGYGTLLGFVLAGRSRPTAFRRATWGFAAVVVLAGAMNLLGVASRGGLLTLIPMGMVPGVWGVWRDRGEPGRLFRTLKSGASSGKVLWFLAALCAVLLTARIGSAVVGARSSVPWAHDEVRFNEHDDLQSYLVYPFRLLQTGTLGQDPFNARRNEASIGGVYVPTALILVALTEDNTHFFEGGISLVLVCGLIWEFAGILGVSHRLRAVIVLYALLVLFHNFNLTSYLSGSAIILAILCTLGSAELNENGSLRSGILLGVLIGAMASLKSTFIPPLGILLSVDFLWRMIGRRPALADGIGGARRSACIRMYLAAAVVTVAVMIPWMLDLKRSAGTLLYPLLGRGYHGSVFGPYALPGDAMSATLRGELFVLVAFPAVLAILAAIFLYRANRMPWEQRGVVVATVIAWFLGLLVIGWTTGYGFGVERYIFSMSLAGQVGLIAVIFAMAGRMQPSPAKALPYRVVIAAVACLVFRLPEAWILYGNIVPNDLMMVAAGKTAVYDRRKTQMAAMQNAIPPGERIMARLTHPHVLNFQRNTIFVADWPGEFSAPPGLPLKRGAEALASYLRGQSIRYVAYSYRTEANYQHAYHAHRLKPDTATWDRTVTEHTFDFQDNLVELGRTRKRVFDDGDVFVLDLEKPIAVAARPQ